ncbi:MAG: hypothetical protein J0I21_02100 [Alphaproteobacteria bacterium]|nr:hypothetical protein [Alphaproteobacteria bacterium]
MPVAIRVADSVTAPPADPAGRVLVTGSHGGRFSGQAAAALGVRGAIFSDAGGGLDDAGIAGLAVLDGLGIPGAAVSHRSARIGDGADLWTRGVISAVNAAAAAVGCIMGQGCAAAAVCMTAAAWRPSAGAAAEEARHLLRGGPVPVWGLDSNSLVRPEDAGAIVVTGSHGGLLGGCAASAVKAPVLAALYNDAGIGIDRAGLSRLPVLAARGIAAAAVAAATARIGDARSTWDSGILSAVNAVASRAGAAPGMTARACVDAILAWNAAAGSATRA